MKSSLYLLIALTIAIISCKPKVTENKDTSIQAEITALEADAYIANHKDIKLLDVRTPEEIADGKINGAIEIDYFADTFASKIDDLDKDQHYLVYCRSGNRSAKAIALMKEKGFTKCTNMAGGYSGYSER